MYTRSLWAILSLAVFVCRVWAECAPSACLSSHAFTFGTAGAGSGGEQMLACSSSSEHAVVSTGYMATIQTPKPPLAVNDLVIQRSGNSIVLSWSPVTTDIEGHPLRNIQYAIYGVDTTGFAPILLGNTTSSVFARANEITTRPRRFYFVVVLGSSQ